VTGDGGLQSHGAPDVIAKDGRRRSCGLPLNKLDVYVFLDLVDVDLTLSSSGYRGDGQRWWWRCLRRGGTGEHGVKA
jgi:hypothetical protein